LNFRKPFAATNTVEFTLEAQGQDTLVSWIMDGPQPFTGKIMDVLTGCEKMLWSPVRQRAHNPERPHGKTGLSVKIHRFSSNRP